MFELPRLLVVGAAGQVGYEVVSLAQEQGFQVCAWTRQELDIDSEAAVAAVLEEYQPDYLVNASTAGEAGAAVLAAACAQRRLVLVQLSCAEVFDGQSTRPYTENLTPQPATANGRVKWREEEAVRACLPHHLILRTGWLFSARGNTPVKWLLDQARRGHELEVSNRLEGAPTSAADLARVILALIKQLDTGAEAWGTYHYTGSGPISWFGFCEAIIAAGRQYEDLALQRLLAVDRPPRGLRELPACSLLDCSRIRGTFGIHQRSWRTGLMRVMRELHEVD